MKWLIRLLDPVMTSNVGEVSSLGMKNILLWLPFENLWFIDKQKYWDRDKDFEMSECSRSTRSLFFVGWNAFGSVNVCLSTCFMNLNIILSIYSVVLCNLLIWYVWRLFDFRPLRIFMSIIAVGGVSIHISLQLLK